MIFLKIVSMPLEWDSSTSFTPVMHRLWHELLAQFTEWVGRLSVLLLPPLPPDVLQLWRGWHRCLTYGRAFSNHLFPELRPSGSLCSDCSMATMPSFIIPPMRSGIELGISGLYHRYPCCQSSLSPSPPLYTYIALLFHAWGSYGWCYLTVALFINATENMPFEVPHFHCKFLSSQLWFRNSFF